MLDFKSLHKELLSNFQSRSDQPLLLEINENQKQRVSTYQDVLNFSGALGAEIKEKTSQMNIGVLIENYGLCEKSLLAGSLNGYGVALLNPKLGVEAISKFLKILEIDLLVVDQSEKWQELGCTLLDVRSLGSGEAQVVEGASDLRVGDLPQLESDPDFFLFTSGSTGAPKAVKLSFFRLYLNSKITAERLGLSGDDRIFVNTPGYFTSGTIHFLTLLSQGGSVAFDEGFYFGKDLLGRMGELKCTGFGGAPAHFMKVLNEDCAEAFPESLKWMVSSGDHLDPNLIKWQMEYVPQINIFVIYGLTEVAGRLCILNTKVEIDFIETVGSPHEIVEFDVVDETGVSLLGTGASSSASGAASNLVGEVVLRGPLLFDGYFHQTGEFEATGSEFKTGDQAKVFNGKYLQLYGRSDGVFKSGAEKISSFLIQDELMKLGLFKEIFVRAKEDAVLGVVPEVVFSLKPGAEFNKREIRKQLKELLPANHIPKSWVEVDALPRTGSGKVDRKQLNRQVGL